MNLTPIEIVLGNSHEQTVIDLMVPSGTRVIDALMLCKLTTSQKIGIFGRLVSLETILNTNDRIEIYEPLIIDPKEARRLRAKKS